MFHAPPLTAIDTAEARDHVVANPSEVNNGDLSPTFNRRDESPSGSFDVLESDQRRLTSSSKGANSGESKSQSPDKVCCVLYIPRILIAKEVGY